MKKLLVCVLVLVLIGCMALAELDVGMAKHNIGPFSFSLPADWVEDGEDLSGTIQTNAYREAARTSAGTGYLIAMAFPSDATIQSAVDVINLYDAVLEELGIGDLERHYTAIGREVAYLWSGTFPNPISDGDPASGVIYYHDGDVLVLVYSDPASTADDLQAFSLDVSKTVSTVDASGDNSDAVQTASVNEVDLSGMSYEELVVLKDRINLAMWECDEWQEVTVPEGVWTVGEDIPAGHWTIRAAGKQDYFYIWYCDDVNPVTQSPAAGSTYVDYDLASPGFSAFGEANATERDIEMQDGWYFINKDQL